MSTLRQLPLPFAIDTGFAASDFLEGAGTEAARIWLARTAAWPQSKLALYGDAGVGKSHLLHIWAVRAGANVMLGPGLRSGSFRLARAVAVDDADLIADERALLHLLNFAGEAGAPVLLAGRAPPSGWGIGLADLASRLRAIQAVAIAAPDEALLALLFARFLSARQLVVQPELQMWLLERLPRHPAALAEAAARLDRAALAAGRRVGRRMAAEMLAALGVSEEDHAVRCERGSLAEPLLL
ncbi:MAG: chromosomal replication initiator DnaA [Acetobacteraceae bacterium]